MLGKARLQLSAGVRDRWLLGLDALLVGFYKGKRLYFAGAVRGGFNPVLRREVHAQVHLDRASPLKR